ncbi:MAG: TRAP transporter permease, partial [Mesorhizobium sp.]
CVLGITCLGAALSRYLLVRTRPWENALLVLAAFLLVAPELYSSLLGVVLVIPVLLRHWSARHTDEAQPA